MFAQFLRAHSRLAYLDPSTFMKPGWQGNAEYKALWEDFPLWHYGECAQEMKRELIAHARSKGLNTGIRFGISSWLPFKRPSAAGGLSAFDFNMQQTYINWAASWLGGSPKKVGDVLH